MGVFNFYKEFLFLLRKKFPDEARKAAKGERDEKIYGTATKKQIKELEKEGIDVFKVPEIKDN